MIHVSELVFPDKVTPVVSGDDQVVVSIIAPKVAEEDEVEGEEEEGAEAAAEDGKDRIGPPPGVQPDPGRRPALAAHGGLFYLRS
jgi:hypothetical protein